MSEKIQQKGQPNPPSKLSSTSLYFQRILMIKGQHLSKFDNVHIMMMYFCTFGLAATDSLNEEQKTKIRQYVLSLELPSGGWTSTSFYTNFQQKNNRYSLPHIVFTYSAINILAMVGGIDKINKEKCLSSVHQCKKGNGSYSSFSNTEEADLRFVYSAVNICNTLQDFSKMDVEKVAAYIDSCYNFDGGYGLRPNCQSHSGAIYCALASLKMLKKEPKNSKRTLNFLVNRQTVNLSESEFVGVQGRVGKFPDSCYSFWVGASIYILTNQNLLNPHVQNFINLCFNKYPTNTHGDPVHTCHSIIGTKIARNFIEDLCLQRGVKRS